MVISGNYEKGRLKFNGYNDVPSDKGINKHNRVTRWFRKTIKFDFFDTNTNQNKATYLNRQSAIKWLQSNNIKIDKSASNNDIRQKIIAQVAQHQKEISNKLTKALNFSDDSIKKSYRNIECEFQKSMTSPNILVFTKNDEGKIGKIFRLSLENEHIQIKEEGAEENFLPPIKLQEASLEKLSAEISNHSGLSVNNLLKQLQLEAGNALKEKFKDMQMEFTPSENPDQLKVKVSLEDNTEQYFQLIVDEHQRISIQRENVDPSKANTGRTIPLEKASIKWICEDLYILNYNDPSNKGILWKKLITMENSTLVIGGDCEVLMGFKPSKTSDCVEIRQDFSKKVTFRMYLDRNMVTINQVLEEKESPVVELPLESIDDLDHLVKLLAKFAPQKTNKPKFKLGKMGAAKTTRMFASVYLEKDEVLKKVNELGLQPDDKKVSEFPSEKIDAFYNYFGISDLERKLFFNSNTSLTVSELIKEIKQRKKDGLDYKSMHEGMYQVVTHFIRSKEITAQDKNLFEVFEDRIEEQFNLYFSEIDSLWNIEDKKLKATMAEKIAQYILLRIDSAKYKEIGFFVNGGWSTKKSGHHINIEIRKIDGQFYFYLANAGAGVQHHSKVKDHRGVVIKIFKAQPEDASEILKKVILLLRTPDVKGKHNSNTFYRIFKKAKTISNSNIPTRPLQTGGNCGVRNQEECLFYACQRLERVDAANNFLKSLEEMLGKESEPFFKEKLNEKGTKEPIKPLLKR